MLLATSAAVSKDIGLLVTFLGIGLVVNVILVYVAIQVRGERSQNQEYMASRQSNGRSGR
jgi:nitrogen fixation protein FixH